MEETSSYEKRVSHRHWYKVWCSILTDPDFEELSNELAGIWLRLTALVASHGVKGHIEISPRQSNKFIGLSNLDEVANAFRSINVEIKTNGNGKFAVTFLNWHKYQVDSTGSERQKRYREAQKRNDARKEKEEEKEQEKNKNKNKKKDKEETPIESAPTPQMIIEKLQQSPAYKMFDVEREWFKMVVWCNANRKKPSERRFVRWLNNIEVPIESKVEDMYKWD